MDKILLRYILEHQPCEVKGLNDALGLDVCAWLDDLVEDGLLVKRFSGVSITAEGVAVLGSPSRYKFLTVPVSHLETICLDIVLKYGPLHSADIASKFGIPKNQCIVLCHILQNKGLLTVQNGSWGVTRQHQFLAPYMPETLRLLYCTVWTRRYSELSQVNREYLLSDLAS